MASNFKVGDIVEYSSTMDCHKLYKGSIGLVVGGPIKRNGGTYYSIAWVMLNKPFASLAEPTDQFIDDVLKPFMGTSNAPED
jgi:hypothetical protein